MTTPPNGPTLKLLRLSEGGAVPRRQAAAVAGLTGVPLYGTRAVGRLTALASLLAGMATLADLLGPLGTAGTGTGAAPFTRRRRASSVGHQALHSASYRLPFLLHGTIVLTATPISSERIFLEVRL